MTAKPLLLPPMVLFAVASLAPAALLAATLLWGLWPAACLVYMTVFVAVLDQFLPSIAAEAPEGAEFPAAEALLVAIAVVHAVLLPATVWAVVEGAFTLWDRALIFIGAGLWIGQVAVPAAHELIHRGDRWRHVLGAAIYTSILFGHHTSAHRLVHHRHVASMGDPNTAKPGEGFYRFLPRAWIGSFRAGLAAERGRRGHVGPYLWYVLGGLAAFALGGLIAGFAGMLVWGALSFHAQSQLLLSDYVQHYGLRRETRADGRLEPVGPRHSWNAPHWLSGGMMLNAPRHSDHHAHPSRPYPALRILPADEAPELPLPLPLSCSVALIPPLWRRMMAPRLAEWRKTASLTAL